MTATHCRNAFVVLGLTFAVAAKAPAQGNAAFDFAARRAAHWAWQPLAIVQPPVAIDQVREPVDAFVQQRLRDAGLSMSGPAAPHVQLRRLWFDVVGLPPPPESVTRFVADPSDAAWAKEVDLLLASPHYAERWARHWLDLVRYSETLGHEFDFTIPNAWRYRDYVIRALHDDVPYDQFVREHLAGDLLPAPRRDAHGGNESIQGTAAWWFAEQSHSPVDAIQHEADRIDNQIDVFGKAVLGLTVACARCHDHKFDAIRTADYYSLAGFVRSSRYVQAPIQPVDVDGAGYRAVLDAQRTVARTWVSSPANANDSPIALRPNERLLANADDPAAWIRSNDGFGAEPWRGPWCPDPTAAVAELRLLPGAFWHSGIAGLRREGVLQSRTFAIEQRYLHVRAAGRHSRVRVIVDGFYLLRDPIYGRLHRAVDDQNAHWLTFDLEPWLSRPAYVQCVDQAAPELADPQHDNGSYPDDGWLAIGSIIASPESGAPANEPLPELPKSEAEAVPKAVREALHVLAQRQEALPVSETVPALCDGTGSDGPIFLRGSHRTPGAQAPRRFLEALAGAAAMPTGPGSGRLQLAEAVLAKDNPLPARVLVNRLWHHLFGRGLVKSVDNLGALGNAPSHPELLDWLARDCIAHGWSQKHVLRQLLRSATYRQDSHATDTGNERDPDNLLLHRQNVTRLSAEAVRDALLAVSGRLDPTVFGVSVPTALDGVPHARGKPNVSGPLDGRCRRSIYLAIRRNFMPSMLQAFDLPTPFATVGARNVSNVPAQALTLLNDPFVHLMSAAWASRVLADPGHDVEARLRSAYQLAFARAPRDEELARCREFLTATATELGTNLDDVRPWAALLHGLANTKEFTFRR